ncbi:MAG: biopolymer transporter ExbD [Verrucomicrobiae bacterium]|nr:biopolymer transporter ExbD [Verrucomicrobiae bacterium]
MSFYQKRRRRPEIVLVSLMDVLIILLIFFMVTTTFKKALPNVQLSLPESKQAATGAETDKGPLTLTIDKAENLFLRDKPIAFRELAGILKKEKEENAQILLELRSDEKVSFGLIIKIMDAAKEAKIENIKALTREPEIK